MRFLFPLLDSISRVYFVGFFYLGQIEKKKKRKWRLDAQTHGFITGGNDASKNIIFTGFFTPSRRRWREKDGKRSTYSKVNGLGRMDGENFQLVDPCK